MPRMLFAVLFMIALACIGAGLYLEGIAQIVSHHSYQGK